MLDSVDIDCGVNLLAKRSVDITQRQGLREHARQRVQTTNGILRAAKNPSDGDERCCWGAGQRGG
jgi:hypothetical protein